MVGGNESVDPDEIATRIRQGAVPAAGRTAFDVTVRVAALLLASSGEGVGMLERYVARVARAFRIEVGVLILPEQALVTDLTVPAATPVAVVRTAPGLSRLDR